MILEITDIADNAAGQSRAESGSARPSCRHSLRDKRPLFWVLADWRHAASRHLLLGVLTWLLFQPSLVASAAAPGLIPILGTIAIPVSTLAVLSGGSSPSANRQHDVLKPVKAPKSSKSFDLTGLPPKTLVDPIELVLLKQREKLLSVMHAYGERDDIPYVWGGSAVGAPEDCKSCRICIASQRHIRVERRHKACIACRRCGLDCSHFVQRVYKDAGLELPYASTRELRKSSPRRLRQRYGLIDLGRDISALRPGDLLLHPQHVTLFLGYTGEGRGDILHSSRSIEAGGQVGGVEIARDRELKRFRGPLLKVLRHEDLVERPLPLEDARPAQRSPMTEKGPNLS